MGIRKYRGRIVCDKRWPDGERITRRCKNRTKAKELLARIEASIADGSWPEFRDRLRLRDRGSVTLRDFETTYLSEYVKTHNKYKTLLRKKASLKKLIDSPLGRRELDAITPSLVHQYVKSRKALGAAAGTINRDLATVRHLLSFAAECGVIDVNPLARFKNLREEQIAHPRYTESQIQKVIDKVRPDCKPLFVFIRETGCRLEEAVSLEHWQVQIEKKVVVFSHNTKSGRYRYVPLTDLAIEAVTALPVVESCPYVFYNRRSKNRWHNCRKPWEDAREEAGILDLKVKDLRSHYAIRLAESGASMHDIQQVLGHTSVAITERHYAQFSPEHSSRRILKVLEGGRRSGNKTETCSEVA